MKLPDFFYIKQTRVLNNLHAFSIELLARLNSRSNPQNAYDSEWGYRQIGNLTVSIEGSLDTIGKEMAGRLLRQRVVPPGFSQRPELDRDTLKLETLQLNIEQEMKGLFYKKLVLIGWIVAGLILAILACQFIQLSFPV